MKTKIIKKLLTIIIGAGSLFLCSWLYADTMDREDVRARESSAQRDEAAQEAWRVYQYRMGEYEKLFPKQEVSLEDYMKYKMSASERAETMARDGGSSGADIVAAGTTGTGRADATPVVGEIAPKPNQPPESSGGGKKDNSKPPQDSPQP